LAFGKKIFTVQFFVPPSCLTVHPEKFVIEREHRESLVVYAIQGFPGRPTRAGLYAAPANA
jgi:hypothetical protein